MLYCPHTPVACSSFDCRHHVAQKDLHKGCLHYSVSCEHCHTSMMKKDLEVGATALATQIIILNMNLGAPKDTLSLSIHGMSSLLVRAHSA
jgi:hypothetical protein